MLTARPIMSASCIVLSPIVALFDGTRRLNGANCAIAVTGASAARSHMNFHLNGRRQ
jgi:hypothetical protein